MKTQTLILGCAVAITQLIFSLQNVVLAVGSDSSTSSTAIPLTSEPANTGPHPAATAPSPLIEAIDQQAVAAPFIENAGQTHADVAFFARTFAGTLFVTHSGDLVVSLPDATGERRAVIRETLGRERGAGVTAGLPAVTRINYLTGDPASSRTNVRTYESVSLGERYPGIDVELRNHSVNVEKFFHVRPGADPTAINVEVAGVNALRLENDGRLMFTTELGSVSMSAPIAYQMIEGTRHPVSVNYRVGAAGYGFEVGAYDRDHTLTIDPVLASYLGGTDLDQGYAIDAADDGSGELAVYVTGTTRSADFPGATGADQEIGAGSVDAFVAKLDTEFNTLVTTYLGGDRDDEGRDLLVHAPNNVTPAGPRVFVTGTTNSSDFVPRDLPDPDRPATQVDAFVVRLSPDLDVIEGATYLGGSGSTNTVRPYAMAIRSRPAGPYDSLYITGRTRSSLLTGSGAFGKGADDVFVSILTTENTLAVERSIYLGGSFNDQAFDIVLDDDSAYVAGLTSTGMPFTADNLPGIVEGDSAIATYDGNEDGFVAKLALDDLALIRSTYYGGVERDFAQALVLHPNGDLYVAGGTFSTDIDFPDPSNAAYADPRGGMEAWLAAFDTGLTVLREATYFGGSITDAAYDLHVHPVTSELMVYGRTLSTDLSDTAGGLQSTGSTDVFLARVDPALSTVNQATYYGGTLFEEILGPGMDIEVDTDTGALAVFITGTTGSDDLPGVGAASAQSMRGGSNDAFVASLDPSLQLPGPMVAAVLPTSRAVATTTTATAFATLFNAGPTTLINCAIAPSTSLPVDFTYQTTDPATNVLIGTANTPVPIPTASGQSFVVAFAPTQAFAGTEVIFEFACDDVAVAPIPGVNTLYLSASDTPGPDVIALAASAVPGQVVLDSVNGADAFAVATANVGVSGSISVSARTNTSALVTVCQTNPSSGVCLDPPVAAPVPLTIAAGDTPTFGVFAFSDAVIGFDPAVNRVYFEVRTPGGNLIGSTSVAISKPQ